jgi:hypothetical protein
MVGKERGREGQLCIDALRGRAAKLKNTQKEIFREHVAVLAFSSVQR